MIILDLRQGLLPIEMVQNRSIMKIDSTYRGLFNSIGYSVIMCTLLVSAGKYFTSYYFLVLILTLIVIFVSLAICDYRQHPVKPFPVKKRKQKCNKATHLTQLMSRKSSNWEMTTTKQHSSNFQRLSRCQTVGNLRKTTLNKMSLSKQDQGYFKMEEIVEMEEVDVNDSVLPFICRVDAENSKQRKTSL